MYWAAFKDSECIEINVLEGDLKFARGGITTRQILKQL